MAGERRPIPAATQAALWALSNGRCYAPGCPFPVVAEVRPGVYRKNAQIAHIYGIKPGAPRYHPGLRAHMRDSFRNLILLCLAHHAEVDDRVTGEQEYPPALLLEWKTKHEGDDEEALAVLGNVTDENLAALLVESFTPVTERLESIAEQLERTGTLNADAVRELQQIVKVVRQSPSGLDARTVRLLTEAAIVFDSPSFDRRIRELRVVVDGLQDAAGRIRRASGEW